MALRATPNTSTNWLRHKEAAIPSTQWSQVLDDMPRKIAVAMMNGHFICLLWLGILLSFAKAFNHHPCTLHLVTHLRPILLSRSIYF